MEPFQTTPAFNRSVFQTTDILQKWAKKWLLNLQIFTTTSIQFDFGRTNSMWQNKVCTKALIACQRHSFTITETHCLLLFNLVRQVWWITSWKSWYRIQWRYHSFRINRQKDKQFDYFGWFDEWKQGWCKCVEPVYKGFSSQNMSIVFMKQNLFVQGKHKRSISLISHYLVVFKNPRERHNFHVFQGKCIRKIKSIWTNALLMQPSLDKNDWKALLIDSRAMQAMSNRFQMMTIFGIVMTLMWIDAIIDAFRLLQSTSVQNRLDTMTQLCLLVINSTSVQNRLYSIRSFLCFFRTQRRWGIDAKWWDSVTVFLL